MRRTLMRFSGAFLYTLNLWTPSLGVPHDAFCSAAVTDTSAFDVNYVFPPLLPIARLSFVVGVSGLIDRYDANGSQGQCMRLFAVFDHRIIGGVYAGRISRHLRSIWAELERHFDVSDVTS